MSVGVSAAACIILLHNLDHVFFVIPFGSRVVHKTRQAVFQFSCKILFWDLVSFQEIQIIIQTSLSCGKVFHKLKVKMNFETKNQNLIWDLTLEWLRRKSFLWLFFSKTFDAIFVLHFLPSKSLKLSYSYLSFKRMTRFVNIQILLNYSSTFSHITSHKLFSPFTHKQQTIEWDSERATAFTCLKHFSRLVEMARPRFDRAPHQASSSLPSASTAQGTGK